MKASRQMLNSIGRAFTEARGTDSVDMATLRTLACYASEHGSKRVRGWIAKAVQRVRSSAPDQAIGCYVSGIRRSWLAEKAAKVSKV